MWAGVWRTLKVTDEELDKLYYGRKFTSKVKNPKKAVLLKK